MNGIDWTLLRSFLAVIEAGSLSVAAARMASTQPTLSRHIRELEVVLGVTLFERSARGLDPSRAALALVDDVRTMGAAANSLALKAQGRSQDTIGTVRITASVIVANLVLPRILGELHDAEPTIRLEIVASDASQDLLRRDADIAIRMFDPTQKALVARKLGEAPIGLYGSRSYFGRAGRVETMEDMRRHAVIGFDRSDAILRAYAANGMTVTRDDFAFRCDDQMVYWHLLLAGAGIGFALVLVAKDRSDLEQIKIGMHVPPLPVWIVMHEEVRTNARIRRVADHLTEALTAILRTV